MKNHPETANCFLLWFARNWQQSRQVIRYKFDTLPENEKQRVRDAFATVERERA